MSQDITIHHSNIDGRFYLLQDRSSVHRHSLNSLGNGFETLEQAEQRKADIESGAWKDASKRIRIGFDPLSTSVTPVSPNKAPAKKSIMPSSISTDPCHRVADALRRLTILLPESPQNGKRVLVDTAFLADLLLSIAEDLDPALVDPSDSSDS